MQTANREMEAKEKEDRTYKGPSAEVRTRNYQHGALTKLFVDAMSVYQQMQSTNQTKFRARTAREYKIGRRPVYRDRPTHPLGAPLTLTKKGTAMVVRVLACGIRHSGPHGDRGGGRGRGGRRTRPDFLPHGTCLSPLSCSVPRRAATTDVRPQRTQRRALGRAGLLDRNHVSDRRGAAVAEGYPEPA